MSRAFLVPFSSEIRSSGTVLVEYAFWEVILVWGQGEGEPWLPENIVTSSRELVFRPEKQGLERPEALSISVPSSCPASSLPILDCSASCTLCSQKWALSKFVYKRLFFSMLTMKKLHFLDLIIYPVKLPLGTCPVSWYAHFLLLPFSFLRLLGTINKAFLLLRICRRRQMGPEGPQWLLKGCDRICYWNSCISYLCRIFVIIL